MIKPIAIHEPEMIAWICSLRDRSSALLQYPLGFMLTFFWHGLS